MDWLRQIPIGQYVDGAAGWLRQLDPRLKLLWVLMFLLTPVLAGPIWRVALVLVLVLITAVSGLPPRLWWRSLLLVVLLGCGIGLLAMLLPTGEPGRPQPPGTDGPPTVQFCVRTMMPGLTVPSGDASIQLGLKTWPNAEFPPSHENIGFGCTYRSAVR